jgi:hypothetical protein
MKHFSPPMLCLLVGIATYVISALWIIALAFRRNFWVGCVCIVFPIFQLVYVITNWRASHWAFYVHIGGYVLILLAVAIAYFTAQFHTVNQKLLRKPRAEVAVVAGRLPSEDDV